jgi:hypothetical protein
VGSVWLFDRITVFSYAFIVDIISGDPFDRQPFSVSNELMFNAHVTHRDGDNTIRTSTGDACHGSLITKRHEKRY